MSASHHSRKVKSKGKEDEIVLKSSLLDEPTHHSYALQQQALRIATAMQTTLDVYDLIKRFCSELKAIIPFHSFTYKNVSTHHEYHEGIVKSHVASYNLTIENITLGEIQITRAEAFENKEIENIENAISQVMYPLRNALQYHEALVSSLTCPLTGLGNRFAYDTAIKKEHQFCQRHQLNLSLIICDLDKFKRINDTHGHAAGDLVIQKTGELMAEICRNSDIVFRYGGEEFVVILKNTDKAGAKILADRIREGLKDLIIPWQDKSLQVTTSAGIASLENHDSIESLFERADGALYSAKRKGGNHTVID